MALAGNEHGIVGAHDQAVTTALNQLETFAAGRVRKERQSSYRTTGNLVAAVFRHDTSRSLDPHLHSHCILFNATKDSVENCGKLLHVTERHLVIEAEGRIRPLPLKQVNRMSICRSKPLALSPGERLHLKSNGRAEDGRKLAKGELVTLKEIFADGRIMLADGRALSANYRRFTHGYAVTSYAAQGKTVSHVLFSDSASRPTTSAQQWYVTISRGRKGIAIFTSDPEQLRANITRSGERPLAMELRPGVRKRSWIYKLIAKRFGERAARIFDRARRHRIAVGSPESSVRGEDRCS